jgi:hypothetical protein
MVDKNRETNAKKRSKEMKDEREPRLQKHREIIANKLSQETENERETIM